MDILKHLVFLQSEARYCNCVIGLNAAQLCTVQRGAVPRHHPFKTITKFYFDKFFFREKFRLRILAFIDTIETPSNG